MEENRYDGLSFYSGKLRRVGVAGLERSVRRYLDGLVASSQGSRELILEKFLVYCKVGGDEAVGWQLGNAGSFRFLDLCYDWLDLGKLMVSSKKTLLGVVRGFFLANRVPLPQDRHRFKSEKAPVLGELRLDEFRKILFASKLEYRCAFLMMFQSGSGVGELCYMNRVHARHIFDSVRKGERFIGLTMPGRKQKRNIQPYFTFLGGDSVDCLRQLFESRGWTEDTVLFRTEKGDPFTRGSLGYYFRSIAFRLGFIKPVTPSCLDCGGETVRRRLVKDGRDGKGYSCLVCGTFRLASEYHLDRSLMCSVRYRIRTHEIRDLFRTEWHRACTFSGVDPDVGETMMGHSIDPLQYDKIMRDRSYGLGQYRKAVSWLNILSEDPRKLDRSEVQSEMDGMKKELSRLKSRDSKLDGLLEVLRDPEKLQKFKRLMEE